jgi:catalase
MSRARHVHRHEGHHEVHAREDLLAGRKADRGPDAIVQRQLAHFSRVDPEYGAGVAKTLGVRLETPRRG